MSHSFHSVDRATHVKIIAVAFALSAVIGSIALASRSSIAVATATNTGVVKATRSPVMVSNDDRQAIR
jgi:hypothetical protein